MSGDVSSKKRLISITEANLKNKHLYISGHHDFFPKECYGESNGKNNLGKEMNLIVEGIAEPVKSDIGMELGSDRPRNFFRKRGWVGKFFEKHNLQAGDVIAIERVISNTH